MNIPIKYICSCCGKEHNEWPALAYTSPLHYANLSEEDKLSIAELSSDFCIINHLNHTDRFIRCSLSQKVNDHCEDLQYGLWVSLSEKSYEDYQSNFHNKNHEAQYFGWLSNNLPEYNFQDSIPTTVVTQKDGKRPMISPHESFNHPFVLDFYQGITKNEAEKRIHSMLESISNKKESNKKWWKLW